MFPVTLFKIRVSAQFTICDQLRLRTPTQLYSTGTSRESSPFSFLFRFYWVFEARTCVCVCVCVLECASKSVCVCVSVGRWFGEWICACQVCEGTVASLSIHDSDSSTNHEYLINQPTNPSTNHHVCLFLSSLLLSTQTKLCRILFYPFSSLLQPEESDQIE